VRSGRSAGNVVRFYEYEYLEFNISSQQDPNKREAKNDLMHVFLLDDVANNKYSTIIIIEL